MCIIRDSNDADLTSILAWLRQEYDQDATGNGFWNNRRLITEAHSSGKLLVLLDSQDDAPVAFQVGRLLSPGILEVRANRRGRGYGRRLVEYCIERARENDECLLHIDCKPSSSIPFWKRMRFRLYDEAFNERCPSTMSRHAFRVLEKKYDLSDAMGETVEVMIRFCDERGSTHEKVALPGALQSGTMIALPRRVVTYRPQTVFLFDDPYVTICVNGNMLYFGEADCPEAEAFGVKRRRKSESYVIDALMLPVPDRASG